MERFVRAAEYVRMSTDLQKYSTENQSEAIKQYAKARGIKIVRTYADGNHPARDAGVFRRRWYCGPAGGLSSARAGVHGGVDWG
ncbi:recombinase family protein, partial [Brytella acorum]